jgi:hypothetical protein
MCRRRLAATVSREQLRKGSALSNRHFDSTTTAVRVTLKCNGGRKGAKPATIPGFNYPNQTYGSSLPPVLEPFVCSGAADLHRLSTGHERIGDGLPELGVSLLVHQ